MAKKKKGGGQTYVSVVVAVDDAETEARPHEHEGGNLPSGVDEPLAEHRHEDGADGVHGDEDNGHDDAVRQENVGSSKARRRRRCDAASVGVAIVTVAAAGGRRCGAGKGVRVFGDGRLRQVEAEGRLGIVLADGRVEVGRGDGGAAAPSGDPVRARRAEGHGAATPRGAVGAADVGGHDAVADARAGEELELSAVGRDLGHDLARGPARADGHVAAAVLVHEEHVRVGHARAGAEADPGVRVWC